MLIIFLKDLEPSVLAYIEKKGKTDLQFLDSGFQKPKSKIVQPFITYKL